MTRPLARVAPRPDAVLEALRAALSGDGPAVFVNASEPTDVPPDVPRCRPEQAPEVAHRLPPEVPRRIALVVATSGSTAAPKRVALSSNAVLASAAASDSVLGGPGQWVLALPPQYIAGANVLVRSIVAGTTPVVVEGSFDAGAFARASARLDAPLRYTSLVPAQLARLLDDPDGIAAARTFTRILVGGQATPPGLLDRARQEGIAVTRTYGSSETCGGCVYDGRPIGDTRVRIVDGEVRLAGSVLADGYVGDDERTARTFVETHGDRWYRTGDAGALHADGGLSITGRFDDVFISGGIKVSLADVERVVQSLPGQSGAVVVAVPSAEWGERAVVVTTVDVDADVVRQAVRAALGPAAVPVAVRRVDALPTLASGKPDRRALRQLAQ